jgi:signal transduction histidine kinase
VLRVREGRVEAFGERDGLPSGDYAWGAVDRSGAFWFARGHSVGLFRNGRFETLFSLDASNICLTPARDGGMWVLTPTQLLKSDGYSAPQLRLRLASRTVVRAALEGRDGSVWVGTTTEGLLRWDGARLEAVALPRPLVTSLAEDREGNVWAGTDGGGLCRVRRRSVAYLGEESGLPKESAKTVCQDRDGVLWAVLQYGSLMRESGGRWRALTEADGWPGLGASCVAAAPDGGVWVGLMDKGLCRWRAGVTESWGPENGFDIRSVRSLLATAAGDVWIVTDWPNRLRVLRGGRLLGVDAPKGMQAMIALAEGKDGAVWAGTSSGQLYRVQGLRLVCEDGAAPAQPSYVRSLHADGAGNVWVGYGGSGLGRWRDGRFSVLTPEDGLADRNISQLQSDGLGRLWMTGGRGLFSARIDEIERAMDGVTNRLRCSVFGRCEGLANLQPMWQYCPTSWRASDGRLLFAVGSGLLEVRPDAVSVNPVAPLVALSRVSVDDRVVASLSHSFGAEEAAPGGVPVDLRAGGRGLCVPPRHEKVEFSFTALSFSSPENVHFRYRLSGFDRSWVEGGSQRDARYPRLASGRYEFQVTACNDAGVWNGEGARLAFVVRPFFWETWWFRLALWAGAALFVTALTGAVLRRRHQAQLRAVEREHAIEQERSRIAQDMHDQLGSGLTKANMVAEALRRESGVSGARYQVLRETLERLTVTMDELVWAVNPRHDSLDGLAGYVVRYAQEYLADTEIACVLDVPADLAAVTVSAPARHNLFLAFEEALGNAARHAGATQVKVSMAFRGGELNLSVEDNGRGFDEASARAGSHGLQNMRQRLGALGGRCEIESAPEKGTRVRFSLSLTAKPEEE